MKPISVHRHFRVLRTFCRWMVDAGLIPTDPMRGITMILPRTLPRVPEADEITALMKAAGSTFEGQRNRALIALLADSGLRISEALRLRLEDLNFADRTLAIRAGKGQTDRVGNFGAEVARLLRAWVQRRQAHAEDFLFTDRAGRSLTRANATHVLHRLSVKARLSRPIGPHALRHYCACAILRETGDIELVRQVLGHSSLQMTLRYARLTQTDVSAKFRRASPLDNLRAGR